MRASTQTSTKSPDSRRHLERLRFGRSGVAYTRRDVGGREFGIGLAAASRALSPAAGIRVMPSDPRADDRTCARVAPATAKAIPTHTAMTTRLVSVSLPS